jgi:hypothetical protein
MAADGNAGSPFAAGHDARSSANAQRAGNDWGYNPAKSASFFATY